MSEGAGDGHGTKTLSALSDCGNCVCVAPRNRCVCVCVYKSAFSFGSSLNKRVPQKREEYYIRREYAYPSINLSNEQLFEQETHLNYKMFYKFLQSRLARKRRYKAFVFFTFLCIFHATTSSGATSNGEFY